jgi:diguanylate cyclase (GGDEF)-like protein
MQKSQEYSADQKIQRVPLDNNAKQRIIISRTLMAMGGSAAYSLLILYCFYQGLFRGTLSDIFMILAVGWAGYITIFVLILTGVNQRFKDKGMTLIQITWVTAVLMVSVYYIDQVRMLYLMLYLMVMLFAAFQLRLDGFLFIAIIAILGYGTVIFLLSFNRPNMIDLKIEIIQWLVFAFTLVGFSIVGSDLSSLRRMLRSSNVELKAALDKVNEMAITDELTGIFNRRHIMNVLNYQKSLADRGDYSFVACYADLDHFKEVNDRFGHGTGDIVLQKFANLTKEAIRGIDYVARFGGEEFLLILVKTSMPEAVVVSERIRKSIRRFSFGDLSPDLHITVSIGVAEYQSGEMIEGLLGRADGALYRAKESGRNMVVSA